MDLILFYIALTVLNILIVFVIEKIRKKDLSELDVTNEQLKSEAKELNKRINDDVIKYCMIIEQQNTAIKTLKQFVWNLNTEEYTVIPEMIEYAAKSCQGDRNFDSEKKEAYNKIFEDISKNK